MIRVEFPVPLDQYPCRNLAAVVAVAVVVAQNKRQKFLYALRLKGPPPRGLTWRAYLTHHPGNPTKCLPKEGWGLAGAWLSVLVVVLLQ